MEGTPFGRYQLIELLGRGGMGEVWKAFDTATQRVVAVKVLPPQLAADPTFEQRFRREAFAAAGLNDPHVVPIHNFGEIEGRLYVDMRLIEGEDLEHLLARGPLDSGRAVKIVEQIASALNAAHRVGLVHRDVKPSNILIAEDDFAYLIDFGIARGAGETGLTGTGNVVGTWPYMAPERFTTGRSDTRSDIYALACVLYECLTSSRPFPGDSVEQQIAGHLTASPPRPSLARRGISTRLDEVIAMGMAKDPDDRYGTTTELARAARTAITAPTRNPLASNPPISSSAPTQRGEDLREQWPATQARMPEATDEAQPPTQARPRGRLDPPWAPTHHRPADDLKEPFAPTQHRPAENVRDPYAPTEYRPGDDRPRIVPPPSGGHDEDDTAATPLWRRPVVMVPIAIILIMAAVVTILLVVLGKDQAPRQTGPLDGTFALDFSSATMPNGQPYSNAQGGRETWVFKSACRGGTCVATGSRVTGSQSTATTLVLDQIGGRWVAVSAIAGTCQNAPTEYWESMSVQPRSDGTLSGEFIVRSTTSCSRNQQLILTRTGDIQGSVSLADPTALPPRVASPAQGLYGRYKETDTYSDNQSAQVNFTVQAYCLRTGQRCLSSWTSADDIKTLIFADNKWVLATTSKDVDCKNGGRAHQQISLEYPLPQQAQSPITLLTGRGHYTVTGECPYSSDFDSRVERIGD